MNNYTEQLEKIIFEMKTDQLVESEYDQWLEFLKQINPESELLKGETISEPKQYTDIREIIILAETENYPVWFIRPYLTGESVRLSYEQGDLKDAHTQHGNTWEKIEIAVPNIPKTVKGFNGKVFGILSKYETDELIFVACDTDNKINFLQKMEILKNSGFTTSEYVSFPTNMLKTVSINKFEASINNFLSAAKTFGAKVDGAVIMSDAPFSNNEYSIIFKPRPTAV